MAPEPRDLFQRSQGLIVGALREALKVIWPTLDQEDLTGTKPAFLTSLTALIREYGNASASSASDFYKQERQAARVGAPIRVTLPSQPPVAQIQSQMEWAVSNLYDRADPNRSATSFAKIEGVASTLVLNQGRRTIVDTTRRDRKSVGWARVTEPGACYFCLLLATRGPVYKKNSFNASDALFEGAGKFKVHDHCVCMLEPMFKIGHEATAQVRAAEAIYKTMPRTSGDVINDFRRAIKSEREAGRFPD